MSGITIRPVTAASIKLLAAMHAEAFPDDPWDEAALTSVLGMPGAFGRIACRQDGDEPVCLGFTLGLLICPECEILSIGVLPNRRRQGVAARLIEDFLSICQASGVETVFLEVAEDNHAARKLYDACEFDRIGRRPHYYRRSGNTWADALQLKRHLA